MLQMPYVCLYLDYLDSFRGLSDAACGKLIKAMLHYAATGEESPLTGPARILWPSIRSQLDRDAKKYISRVEASRANGAKGGRPPKNPEVISETNGFLKKPRKPKEKEKEKDNKNNNDNNNDNANANEKENANEREKSDLKENEKETRAQLRPPAAEDPETLAFVRRADQIRRDKALSHGDDSGLIPLGIPIYPPADSPEPDRWPQGSKSVWR